MTVVVAVKVYDGIVLAADSATEIALTIQSTPGGPRVRAGSQLYNNADKIFQLHRDLPIGLATWGLGHMDSASISTLAKDLRRRLMGRDPAYPFWGLGRNNYTLSGVADRLVEMMYDELFSKMPPMGASGGTGFVLAGYSAGARHPEAWEILINNPTVRPTPTLVMDMKTCGWRSCGQGDAVARLLNGYSEALRKKITPLVPAAQHPALDAAFAEQGRAAALDAMPFADAIALAKFCTEVTIGYTRFSPGADTVGYPIDIAGISRHEGFKWIQRKHYYPAELNPRRPHEHDQ